MVHNKGVQRSLPYFHFDIHLWINPDVNRRSNHSPSGLHVKKSDEEIEQGLVGEGRFFRKEPNRNLKIITKK